MKQQSNENKIIPQIILDKEVFPLLRPEIKIELYKDIQNALDWRKSDSSLQGYFLYPEERLKPKKFTQAHIDIMAECLIKAVYYNKEQIKAEIKLLTVTVKRYEKKKVRA